MRRLAFGAAAAFVVAMFLGLGVWQLERRAWKHELIARVDAGLHAPAVEAPTQPEWPALDAAQQAYRRVGVSGVFRNDRETLVQAVTVHGAGFWVMTPLERADGTSVLVNRGFVPPEAREPAARAATTLSGPVTVTGLLRPSEPGGGFLRTNDAAADRWHSRDVTAIAAARGLRRAAPYFVDADAAADTPADRWPAAGLTVVRFSDNHMVYALTWFALAAMSAAAAWFVRRQVRRR